MLLWVLAIVLLPIRMANAHLHMCLDGQERAVSVHIDDVPTHHGALDEGNGHNDLDLDLDVSPSLSVTKADSADTFSPIILGTYVLAVLLPEQRHSAPEAILLDRVQLPTLDLRPPPRGPPC